MKYFIVTIFLLVWSSLAAAEDTEKAEAEKPKLTAEEEYQKKFEKFFPEHLGEMLTSFQSGNYQKALKQAAKIKSTKTGKRQAPEKLRYLQGLTAQAMKDHKQAIQYFNKSLQLRQTNSEAHVALGRSLLALGDLEVALQHFEESLWFNRFGFTPLEEVFFDIAMIQINAEKKDQAKENLKKALAQNSAYKPAYDQLISILISEGNRPEALKVLRAAASKDNENVELQLTLSNVLLNGADKLLNQSDILKAKELSAKALEKEDLTDLQKLEAFKVNVKANMAAGELETAESQLKSAKSVFPNSADLQQIEMQLDVEKAASASTKATS